MIIVFLKTVIKWTNQVFTNLYTFTIKPSNNRFYDIKRIIYSIRILPKGELRKGFIEKGTKWLLFFNVTGY